MYGTSGGALTGALLFLDIDLDALAEYIYICAAKARGSWRGAFLLRDYCRGAITQFCTKDAHKILAGRLEISITRIFPWYKNIRVNEFPTYDFLIQSLLCSACITPLAGLPMWLPGHGLCFDGGVSDLQLVKGLASNGTFCKLHCRKTNPEDIIVVCPFYSSRADIRPSKYVPMWWAFFPPAPYKLKELFELGQKDAHAWADKQDESSPSSSPSGAKAAHADADEGVASPDEWESDVSEKTAKARRRMEAPAPATATGWGGYFWWWRRPRAASAASAESDSDDLERSSGGLSADASETGSDVEREGVEPRTPKSPMEWAAECQEWCSLSAEAAARRAVRAATMAARTAEDFMHHEAEVAFEYASGAFCEAQAAAEAMRRAATRTGKRGTEEERRDATDAPGYGLPGTFRPHRLVLRWIACVVIYCELMGQALFYALGAAAAVLLPGVDADKMWRRSLEFCRPAPRVLLQPVPMMRPGARINAKTAKMLGKLSVTYRVLCYLVHMETVV